MDFEGFSAMAPGRLREKHSISENSALLYIPNEEVTFEL